MSEDKPGTGEMMLGAMTVSVAVTFAALLLWGFQDLLQGNFDKLPFLENFLAITSKTDSLEIPVQGVTQVVKIPHSFFFISGLSMFIFALSIAARLLRAMLQGGVALIQGKK